jgi:hypothetical protein
MVSDGSGGSSGAAGTAGGGGRGGSAGASGEGGAAAPGDFNVTLEASRMTLCPGQCAELTATPHDGRAPFEYSWTPALGEGPGPHEVCPEEDTTYSVTVRDFALEDDEFGMTSEEASAAIELRVGEPCEVMEDGGVVDPPDETRKVCDLRITYGMSSWVTSVVGWESGTNIGGDREGHMFVAAGFSGTIDVAGTSVTSVGSVDAFVIKLDDKCEVVWLETFGGSQAEFALGALGVGPDGDPVVGGYINGSATVGDSTITAGFNSTALLVKLDGSDGSMLWNHVYPSFFYSTAIWDVGVDDDNDVVISGYAAADTSFGGGAIGGGDGNGAFIAKLTSTAAHVFSQRIASTTAWTPLAVHPGGDIALTGWGTGGTEITIGDGTVLLTGTQSQRYAVLLSADGALQWGTTFGGDDSVELVGWWAGGVAIDPDRNLVLEHGRYDQAVDGMLVSRPVTLSKISASGMPMWTQALSDEWTHATFHAQGGLCTDSSGNILITDVVHEPDAEPVLPDAGVAPPSDVLVRKSNPDGVPIWTHRIGSSIYEWAWGVAVDSEDAVWIAHIEDRDVQGDAGALVITKLAP